MLNKLSLVVLCVIGSFIVNRFFQQREANLLGVVGTDVPIEQIKKLVPPYKVPKFLIKFGNLQTIFHKRLLMYQFFVSARSKRLFFHGGQQRARFVPSRFAAIGMNLKWLFYFYLVTCVPNVYPVSCSTYSTF